MFRGLILSIAVAVALAGCPSDDGPACQDCTPGAATCSNNYVVICNEDGKGPDQNVPNIAWGERERRSLATKREVTSPTKEESTQVATVLATHLGAESGL